jgi:hypothetical protein
MHSRQLLQNIPLPDALGLFDTLRHEVCTCRQQNEIKMSFFTQWLERRAISVSMASAIAEYLLIQLLTLGVPFQRERRSRKKENSQTSLMKPLNDTRLE